MVLEYAHQHLPEKSPSFVGKYTSTMEHLGIVNQWTVYQMLIVINHLLIIITMNH
jgi:hypothetical protein